MDTERYVKCNALYCDCNAEIWALAGKYLYPRCKRCSDMHHLPIFLPKFATLEDGLAALAMARL